MLILYWFFLHHMQEYFTTHTELTYTFHDNIYLRRKLCRNSTFTWATSNIEWIKHSILHWAWKLRSDIFIVVHRNSTLTCICQFLPMTILRVSDQVWYWSDLDLDPKIRKNRIRIQPLRTNQIRIQTPLSWEFSIEFMIVF